MRRMQSRVGVRAAERKESNLIQRTQLYMNRNDFFSMVLLIGFIVVVCFAAALLETMPA